MKETMEKIVSFQEYKDKKEHLEFERKEFLEIDRKELLDLIKQVVTTK